MKKVEAVLFDLDGTLLDTAPDFVYVLNKLRAEEGLQALDQTVIRNTVSDGARALVTLGFDLAEGDAGFEPLRRRLLDHYLNHLAVGSQLFPGIPNLLDYLHRNNIHWGIATNKPHIYTAGLLNALKIKADCVICPDHVSHPKPHPESLYLAAKLLECDRENIIYVGDHRRDIECGRRANCVTIAAAYGYIKADDDINLWQATHRVEHAAEIAPIIERYL